MSRPSVLNHNFTKNNLGELEMFYDSIDGFNGMAELNTINGAADINAINSIDAIDGIEVINGLSSNSDMSTATDVKLEDDATEEKDNEMLLKPSTPITKIYYKKHLIKHTWTLWYYVPECNKSWEDMQCLVHSFSTVEDFWALYDHIKPPSELKTGCDYSLFRQGIRPMWEDDSNKNGGRWLVTLPKSLDGELDAVWCTILLAMIGDAFGPGNEVTGAVVNVRGKNNKFSIWTVNGGNTAAILEVGMKLRNILRIWQQNLQYYLHEDTMTKATYHLKPLYSL